jgi:excisionase family DNA binding protein
MKQTTHAAATPAIPITELPERLYSERDTAERLGCARMTLFRWRQEGRIGHYRIGSRIFYGSHHLTVFLESVERQPQAQE